MKTEINAKICIAGVGAIGTLLATIIGQKYSKNLSVLARNKRLEEIRKNGLIYIVIFMAKKRPFLQKHQIMEMI